MNFVDNGSNHHIDRIIADYAKERIPPNLTKINELLEKTKELTSQNQQKKGVNQDAEPIFAKFVNEKYENTNVYKSKQAAHETIDALLNMNSPS